MTKIVNKVNLGYLGTPYQYRLVSSFVNDPRFFVELINIIDQNNEYYIVNRSTSNGISVYDRIVLDAEKYTNNQLIY